MYVMERVILLAPCLENSDGDRLVGDARSSTGDETAPEQMGHFQALVGKDLSVFPWAKAMSSGSRLSGVLTSSWHAPGHQAPQGIRLGQGRVFGRLPLGG